MTNRTIRNILYHLLFCAALIEKSLVRAANPTRR
jgi:hypothetical protein